MAYDSATAVVEAGNAFKRAQAIAAQKRTALLSGYGLNADGSMDNTAAGQLGSLYQGNLQSVNLEHQAEMADRRRGFKGTGGLAGKATAAADQAAQTNQAVNFRNANADLGANTQEGLLAEQDYRDQVGADGTGGIIGRNAAWDLAQTLAANPVQAPAPGPAPQLPTSVQPGSAIPALNYAQLYKSNPKKYRTI